LAVVGGSDDENTVVGVAGDDRLSSLDDSDVDPVISEALATAASAIHLALIASL
jgi:hypothetical protein